MKTLLDTYNLIHAARALGGAVAHLTVRGLCQLITAHPKPLHATLILDGRAKPDEPSANEFPELTLVYSGTGVSADQVISQIVERAKNRKQITVVTNDRAVTRDASSQGATTQSCEAFLSTLITPPASHKKKDRLPPQKSQGLTTEGESDLWLREFGFTAPPKTKKSPPATRPVQPDIDPETLKRLME